MHGKQVLGEIQDRLKDGKTGCIIFDLMCFYQFKENLVFELEINEQEITDQRINHRYPNKSYYTISKTYGREVSRIGYPYFFELQENKWQNMLLRVKIGVKGKKIMDHIFSIKLKLSRNEPVCNLTVMFNYHEDYCDLQSNKKNDDGWNTVYWTTKTDEADDTDIILLCPENATDKNTVIYTEAIIPYTDKPENTFVGF